MQSITVLIENFEVKTPQVLFKNKRDELVSLIVEDINKLRLGTEYKPTNKRIIALRLNSNPFYAKDDGEVELLYKTCCAKKNYSKLFYDCPMYKK